MSLSRCCDDGFSPSSYGITNGLEIVLIWQRFLFPPQGFNLRDLIIFLYTRKRSIFHVPANTSVRLPEKIIHMFQCCASSHQTAGTTGRSGPEGRISAHSHKPPPIMKDVSSARLSSGHRRPSDCFGFIVLSFMHAGLKTTHRIYNK